LAAEAKAAMRIGQTRLDEDSYTELQVILVAYTRLLKMIPKIQRVHVPPTNMAKCLKSSLFWKHLEALPFSLICLYIL